jgi:hypothetical protein
MTFTARDHMDNVKAALNQAVSADDVMLVRKDESLFQAKLILEISGEAKLKKVISIHERLQAAGWELSEESQLQGEVVYTWDNDEMSRYS